ncbi:hypothetical protein [Oryza sativa Japonica Group]|uniref:Uncharacterized protein n=2 Tax=Oryza sativa subsp. japonica TaxID=39947 RepID=Q5N872_ORYSJ|nr:hypothetical protein [Oryza sativa Japonica Group]BAD82763.1 hypothetical protein [Oryza sativa Japonica Group]
MWWKPREAAGVHVIGGGGSDQFFPIPRVTEKEHSRVGISSSRRRGSGTRRRSWSHTRGGSRSSLADLCSGAGTGGGGGRDANYDVLVPSSFVRTDGCGGGEW